MNTKSHIIKHRLLTPSDVADLLQISTKTVYKHQHKFGGFYPAGLGVLRFRQEIIYGIMEGQDSEALVLLFPISKQKLCRQGIQKQTGSRNSKGNSQRTTKTSTARSNRHGIFGGV